MSGNPAGTQGTVGDLVLANAIEEFRGLKKLAEKALDQVDDATFFDVPAPEGDSIAVVVKHIAGNLRSRWTDFLTSDGEKPDRNRDTEFEPGEADTREALMARWQAGWNSLFTALEPLKGDDLQRTITIRGEPHTVIAAIHRQLTHYGNHVGQIVLLAKHAGGASFRSLSIPRGQSTAFNQKMENKFGR
ncbi:MAG: DUF1572 family protein [Candidatus Eiseniibacteriota bacterium]